MMEQVLEPRRGRNSGRRSAFEIAMDVLRVAVEGATKPTHIMYRSNTSWPVLKKCLSSMVASGFLLRGGAGSRAVYCPTEKGKAVVLDYLSLVHRAGAVPNEVQG